MKSDLTETESTDASCPDTRCNSEPEKPPTVPTTIEQVGGVRRVVYIVLAFVFFGLGILGAILPGLPTTPFLLLMSYFLIRVSPSLHAKVLKWPLVGKPLREWSERGGVRMGVKWIAFGMVIFFVSLSLYFGPLHWGLKAMIVCLAMTGLYVVYRLPTIR